MLKIDMSRVLVAAIVGSVPMTSVVIAQNATPSLDSGSAVANKSRQSAVIEEVIVTAQKQSEAINTVPMSITAVTAESLENAGITSTADLSKVVPGFSYADSSYGSPIYFIRGIGFFDTSLASKPTVGVYVDEVPIAFPVMTLGAAFDLERVEVLKGPQGTLFGQNATGGAINYIAATPTDAFAMGIDAGIGNFDSWEMGGFVSGPLADNLRGRLAIKHAGGGAWQESMTRSDELGDKDMTQARMLLDWQVTDDLLIGLNLNGFVDRSETQAAQFVGVFQQSTGYLDPRFPTYPRASDAQDADWGKHSEYDLARDNQMFQSTLRVDYNLNADISLTSLTSYSDYEHDAGQEADGTALVATDMHILGDVQSLYQELRLTGLYDRGNWVAGVNWSKDDAYERDDQRLENASSGHAFDRLGLPPVDLVPQIGKTSYESKAAFGSVTYEIRDDLKMQVGARYNHTDIDFAGCAINSGNQTFGRGFATFLRYPGTIPYNTCATFTDNPPQVPAEFVGNKSEHNVSWRTGLDWNVTSDTLVYGNISRGYKAGAFPTLPGTLHKQYKPVDQEKVTAYELGVKSTLLEQTLQVTGAIFYSDYTDKQLKGRTIVPVFGSLESLVNIPESSVKGAELQLTWLPLAGLQLSTGVTYLDTEVTKGSPGGDYTVLGGSVKSDIEGESFPYTPEWQVNFDAQYTWPATDTLDLFVGTNVNYRSETNGDFKPDPRLDIDAYTLIDLRAGVATADNKWRVTAYGRNISDEYYWTTATRRTDSIVRYAGMPRTYGVSLSYRY